MITITTGGPHAGQPVRRTGVGLDRAEAAIIMVHGRGATAESILTLAGELVADGIAVLAPQAAGNTWYPYSFLEPTDRNEPWLSSALAALGDVLEHVEGAGIPAERIALLGFSQGACLTTEFVARNARRYGGVIVLTGGLIGPDGTPRDYAGSLDGTPVFIGGSDVDFHVPLGRMHESAQVLTRLGGDVDLRVYPGMGHMVNADEIAAARSIVAALPRSNADGGR